MLEKISNAIKSTSQTVTDAFIGRNRFKKLSDETPVDKLYSGQKYDLMSILLTVSGYERIFKAEPREFFKLIPTGLSFYHLPKETQKLIQDDRMKTIIRFEYDHYKDQEESLPKARVPFWQKSDLVPIKVSLNINGNNCSVSSSDLEKDGHYKHAVAWFLGPYTENPHEEFLKQPRLLQKLYFNVQLAQGFAIAFGKNWPNSHTKERSLKKSSQGPINNPIDEEMAEKSKHYAAELSKKNVEKITANIFNQKIAAITINQNEQKINKNITVTSKSTDSSNFTTTSKFLALECCMRAFADCEKTHSNGTLFEKMEFCTEHALRYLKNRLEENHTPDEIRKISIKSPRVAAIINMFNPTDIGNAPTKDEMKAYGNPQPPNSYWIDFCEPIFHRVFPQNNKNNLGSLKKHHK